jgi:hypothetical protein
MCIYIYIYSFLDSILDVGWVVKATPWPLYLPGKRPVTLCTRDFVDLGAVLS